jgi:regulator of replication initiation timing
MSYIDNTKSQLLRENYILEVENEMLRNQIKKLKIEKNELLVNTKSKGEQTDNEGNDKVF